MMAVDDDGLWVHSKFGLSVPRRNGKSEVDKMRELRGLFHSEHTLHTAHRTTTKHSAWIFTNVPLAGEDRERRQGGRKKKISIHVPLAGDDKSGAGWVSLDYVFLSTSPLRGTTHGSPCRAAAAAISIHVPLAGDDQPPHRRPPPKSISIHVPLAGDDLNLSVTVKLELRFLSTSPLRGTTPSRR